MPPAPLSQDQLNNLLAYLAGQDDFVFLETTRITSEDHRSWLFLHPEAHLRCRVGDDPGRFLQQAQERLDQGFYLAGGLAYEFGHLLEPALRQDLPEDLVLADFGVYRTPHIYDHLQGDFTGTAGPWPVCKSAPANSQPGYSTDNLRLSEDQARYLVNIARIKQYIESGDTYQVNYTLKYLFDFQGSANALYQTLRRNQSVSYAAFIRQGGKQILSMSPELFFSKHGDHCTVRPMKGTVGRGLTSVEDEQAAAFLARDPKNRSENIMIVDLLRNDLGRLSKPGKVRTPTLFSVEAYETVYQMTSTVEGDLRPGVNLEELFRAVFPCGSVTGAPKIRTMQIIRELEARPRGIYTGGIGFLTPQGDGIFNVPIRTVLLDGSQGEMGIGSGVVYDSDPEKEWEECKLKGRFLSSPRPIYQLIETMLWQQGDGYWLLDLHLQRMLRSAAHLGFSVDLEQIENDLTTTAATFDEQGATARRVRLLLDKDGTTTISSTECDQPTLSRPPEVFPAAKNLATVHLSDQAIDRHTPYLYHKTTLRELYDLEREKARANGYLEVIFKNRDGQLTEGSFTNLFVQKGRTLFTPPLSCGLLGGVLRQLLLTAHPNRVREKVICPKDLAEMDGLYVGNSVRGLIPVRLIS